MFDNFFYDFETCYLFWDEAILTQEFIEEQLEKFIKMLTE
jgi:hypothetical protein